MIFSPGSAPTGRRRTARHRCRRAHGDGPDRRGPGPRRWRVAEDAAPVQARRGRAGGRWPTVGLMDSLGRPARHVCVVAQERARPWDLQRYRAPPRVQSRALEGVGPCAPSTGGYPGARLRAPDRAWRGGRLLLDGQHVTPGRAGSLRKVSRSGSRRSSRRSVICSDDDLGCLYTLATPPSSMLRLWGGHVCPRLLMSIKSVEAGYSRD